MTSLSPAAQAVLDAFGKHPLHHDNPSHGLLYGALPAALRAAADQFPWDEDFTGMCCCECLKAIAAEVEALSDD